MNVFRFGSPWAWLLLIPFAAVVVVQRRREQPAALYSSGKNLSEKTEYERVFLF